jgi:hypothetical protein
VGAPQGSATSDNPYGATGSPVLLRLEKADATCVNKRKLNFRQREPSATQPPCMSVGTTGEREQTMSKTALTTAILALALVTCACASTTNGKPLANRLPGTAPTGGTGSPSTTARGATASKSSTPVAATQNCHLPLTHATDAGFHIAVPSGWDLSTLNGQVVVGSTPADTEAVLVYPALLTNGLTATRFFTTYLAKLDQDNASAGSPVTIHPAAGSNGGLPAVTFTQTVNGTQRHGEATVEVLPLAAPGATQEAAFISYWAPGPEFASAAGELSAVAACFGPEPARPFRILQDQVFTYAIPPGWASFDETANSIDLHGPGDSDVSDILAGPVQTSEFDSPQSMIGWFLHGVGITAASSLSSVASPNQQASNGGTESDVYEEFTANSGSTPIHGLIFGYTDVGGGVASGYIRMAVAAVNDWNSMNATLVQIAGSIQHNFTQDLQELQRVNRQWQDFSGQVANFDDTLNTQQLVRDPSTGTYYEAPYSAYNANGPRGPGYYLPNGDSLEPVPH